MFDLLPNEKSQPRMVDRIRVLSILSRQCAAITVARHADSRNTHLKSALDKLKLPLISVLNRLKYGLFQCCEADFQRHVHKVVVRFCVDYQMFVRSLKNGMRSREILALMCVVQEFERTGCISE